jgi:hypothetical protein
MKQNRTTFLLSSLAASLLMCLNSQATIWRSSQIVGYNTGNLGADVGTGTLDGWGNSTANVTVTNGTGSLIGTNLGLVASSGDMVNISGTASLSARNQFVPTGTFPQTVETNIYYSFLYRFNVGTDISPNGQTLIRINRGNSGTTSAQHWDLEARNLAGQIQLGISKAGAPSNVTNYATTNISVGQTFFVVVRQHIIPGAQNDIYDLWINPPRESFGADETNIPPSSASVGALITDGTEDSSSTGPGRFVLASGANANFDEFRVTSTWVEATPYFGQCVNAGVAVSPTNLTMSAETAATFRVIGLGTSPTFQWQRSTNAGSSWDNIPGATTATYTTPNLALAESGNQYRALVLVGCNNSSATSAVATITLTAPLVTAAGRIMDDTFLDPGLGFDDRSNPPLSISNSLWYTSVTDNLTAYNQGGNMLGIPVTAGSSLWLGYFTDTNQPPVHLGIGRTLRITLPFIPNSFNSFTNNASLRMGVFDYADGGVRVTADGPAAGGSRGNGVGVRGYMLNLDFGTNFSVSSPLQLLVRNTLQDDNLMGTVGDYASLGSGPAGGGYSNAPAFQAGTQYTLVFSVARTAVSSVNVSASITGGGTNWSHSVTETNYAYHRFDSFGIRPNSLETSADSFTFHQFIVEVLQSAVAVPPFSLTSVQALAPGSVKLTWASVTGATYYLLSADSLSAPTWTTNATIVATGSSTSYTNSPIPGTVTQRYYRVLAPPYSP